EDAMKDGASSIALLDDQADLLLENVDLAAGAGRAGAAGAVQNQGPTPMGANGGNGADNMCGATNNLGGSAGQNQCTDMGKMVDVSGGIGGTGSNGTTGGAGRDGIPVGAMGKGGKPQDANGSCATGGQGAEGVPGMAGDGAHGIADLDATGYHGPLATTGKGE